LKTPSPEPARPADDAEEGRAPAAVTEELERQEALLARGEPAVRVAVVRDRAVSYGVRVPPEVNYLARARAEGLEVAPRTGGGTGLLHLEGDLVWAVVLPRTDPRVGRDFVRAYARLGAPLVRLLADEGRSARWTAAPGLADAYCPLSALGQVLVVDDRIVGGAAQHVTAKALLHHGSLSTGIDRASVDRLFGLAPGGPSARLAGLAELGVRVPPGALAARLERAWTAELVP
jgi:lipoate-protein ligase A